MASRESIVRIRSSDSHPQILIRHKFNPILTAAQWPYPINSVFNPGATLLPDGTTLLLCRVEDRRGEEKVRVVHLRVPSGTPEGRAVLVVADGSSATALRQQIDPSEPRTLRDFATFLSRIVPGNRLLAGILVATRGAATRSATLEELPPTALALLAGAREPGETGIGDVESRLVAEEIVTFDRPVSGTVRIDVEVERLRPRGTR